MSAAFRRIPAKNRSRSKRQLFETISRHGRESVHDGFLSFGRRRFAIDGSSMSDILVRIKRAVLTGNYAFGGKARLEMECDGLTELDVAESILSAVAIYKKLRSTSLQRRGREHLYVIQSSNLPVWRYTPRGSWSTRRPRKPIIFSSPQSERCRAKYENYIVPNVRKPEDSESAPRLGR